MVDDLSWNDPELMLSVALSTASFCVILFALVMALRGSRGLGLSHSLASLLFPLSQLILVTFINVSLVIGPLSPVTNVAVLVVSVLCAVSDHFLFKGLRAAGEHDAVEGQARLVREQVEAQRAYERRLDADRARTRAARALIMKELREAEAMLYDDGDVAEALERATCAIARMDGAKRFCAHPMIDALLSAKAEECARRDVRFCVKVNVPAGSFLPSADLCAVFANMLDNAIAAASRAAGEARFVDVRARVESGRFTLLVANGCASGERCADSLRTSTRRSFSDEHGWGMLIVENIVARHGGVFDVAMREGACEACASMRVDGA